MGLAGACVTNSAEICLDQLPLSGSRNRSRTQAEIEVRALWFEVRGSREIRGAQQERKTSLQPATHSQAKTALRLPTIILRGIVHSPCVSSAESGGCPKPNTHISSSLPSLSIVTALPPLFDARNPGRGAGGRGMRDGGVFVSFLVWVGWSLASLDLHCLGEEGNVN